MSLAHQVGKQPLSSGNNTTEAILESTIAKVKNSTELLPEKSVLIVKPLV